MQADCRDEVDNGVVPNQSGTWWFGCGGWCPGQEITPVVLNMTDSATRLRVAGRDGADISQGC